MTNVNGAREAANDAPDHNTAMAITETNRLARITKPFQTVLPNKCRMSLIAHFTHHSRQQNSQSQPREGELLPKTDKLPGHKASQ